MWSPANQTSPTSQPRHWPPTAPPAAPAAAFADCCSSGSPGPAAVTPRPCTPPCRHPACPAGLSRFLSRSEQKSALLAQRVALHRCSNLPHEEHHTCVRAADALRLADFQIVLPSKTLLGQPCLPAVGKWPETQQVSASMLDSSCIRGGTAAPVWLHKQLKRCLKAVHLLLLSHELHC